MSNTATASEPRARTRRARVGSLLQARAGSWMTTAQAATALGISRYTAHRYAVAGLFPGAVMLSPRKIVLPVEAVEDFLRVRTITGPGWRRLYAKHDDGMGVGVGGGRLVGPGESAAVAEPAAAVE